MKTILCYGDSNTWGFYYGTGGRFSPEERWPNIMQQLGSNFHVIEEGLNGRTAGHDDPNDDYPEARNGRKTLIPCLRSHYPLDLVIIMLGTNDMKAKFSMTADAIAKDIGILANMAWKDLCFHQGYEPKILLAAPVLIAPTIETSPFGEEFGGERALPKSAALADALRRTAERCSCSFLNAAESSEANPIDAIHLSRESHRSFGMAVAQKVQEIFAS